MYSIENEKDFKKIFTKSLYEKIVKETSVRYNPIPTRYEFNEMLSKLYYELENYEYIPDVIRKKVYTYKANNVARIIPIMSMKDEAFYYFVCKMIEEEISGNRVEGTYGGWRIENKIAISEGIELDYAYNSYNPIAWNYQWNNFQEIITQELEKSQDDTIILKLDIANFYDSINLKLLEKKILVSVNSNKIVYVNMLMHFLQSWNMKNDKYQEKTVGLPQNEFGDQSRILANFYLQKYDKNISEFAIKNSAKYMRFADDQLIFIKDKSKLNDILYIVCKELNLIGLNLNASKVKIYTKDELIRFYAKEIFNLLKEEKYDDAAKLFFNYYNSKKIDFNYFSPLKRFLNIGLDKFNDLNKKKLYKIIINKDFIKRCDSLYLNKIYRNLSYRRKNTFIKKILKISQDTTYNAFHYNVINFFIKNNKNEYICLIEKRIKEIEDIK